MAKPDYTTQTASEYKGNIDSELADSAIKTSYEANSNTNAFTDTEKTKLTATLNTKVIDIGDWDMDTDAFISVTHGVTLSKIRSMSAIIRNDLNTSCYDLSVVDFTETGNRSSIEANSTVITMFRGEGGWFDNSSFSTPPDSNRGWITIQYTD